MISENEARQACYRYLADHFGTAFRVGPGIWDDEKGVWILPIFFALSSPSESVKEFRRVAKVWIDGHTGEIAKGLPSSFREFGYKIGSSEIVSRYISVIPNLTISDVLPFLRKTIVSVFQKNNLLGMFFSGQVPGTFRPRISWSTRCDEPLRQYRSKYFAVDYGARRILAEISFGICIIDFEKEITQGTVSAIEVQPIHLKRAFPIFELLMKELYRSVLPYGSVALPSDKELKIREGDLRIFLTERGYVPPAEIISLALALCAFRLSQ